MIRYEDLFYFDIETVGKYPNLEELQKNDEKGYELFIKKYEKVYHKNGLTEEEAYTSYSPLISTYGKIVCISFGYFKDGEKHVKSLSNDNEEELIKEAQKLFSSVSSKHYHLSGFNIETFDIPWVQHKLIKYNLHIPSVLVTYGKKPWEIQSVDLFKEWNSVSRNYSSFDEVCYEIGVPSPKEKIDGSMVHETYWNKKDLKTIVEYCEGDVLSSMLVGEKLINCNI